jgi:hypothetical protein
VLTTRVSACTYVNSDHIHMKHVHASLGTALSLDYKNVIKYNIVILMSVLGVIGAGL